MLKAPAMCFIKFCGLVVGVGLVNKDLCFGQRMVVIMKWWWWISIQDSLIHDKVIQAYLANVSTCQKLSAHVSICQLSPAYFIWCQHMSAHVSTCQVMSGHVSTCQHMSVHVSTCQYMSVHVSTCQHMSAHVSTCQYMSAHVSTCQYMSVHVSTRQYMSVHVSTCHYMSVHVSRTYRHNYLEVFYKRLVSKSSIMLAKSSVQSFSLKYFCKKWTRSKPWLNDIKPLATAVAEKHIFCHRANEEQHCACESGSVMCNATFWSVHS